MAAPDPHTTGSFASEFSALIRDTAAYLSWQKSLGNSLISVSDTSEAMMADWGNPRSGAASPPIRCQGPETARIVLVDSEGTFYSGDAGGLLAKILGAMHLAPDRVWICDAQNPREVRDRIRAQRPGVIITLGEKAAKIFIRQPASLTAFRGKWQDINGIPLMPTLHPGQLLADASLKRPVWEDMQQVMRRTGLAP